MTDTTLAALAVGDQFLFACKVVSVDPTAGIGLELYGPSSVLAATATIAPNGAMSGTLAATPDQIPVSTVTGFAPVAVGDVLQDGTGNTFVCMWTQIQPSGEVLWSNSPDAKIKYSGTGYALIGHVNL